MVKMMLDPSTIEWREFRLRELGFNSDWANFIAQCNMDLNQVASLMSRGASPNEAVRILAGLGPTGDDDFLFDWHGFYQRLYADGNRPSLLD